MEAYELTEMHVDGMPLTFILESDSIDQLLVLPGRRLVGLPRQRLAFEATVTWFGALRDRNLLPGNPRDICTVTILAEGIGHNLPGALATVLGEQYHRGDNWIGVSRFALPKTAEDAYTPFDASVNYLRIHSNARVWCVLDTVATGATLVRGLEAAFRNARKPQQILMATPAGSGTGMRQIADLCAREKVELNLTFFGAIFGLWEDGTGLPWCHPDTVLSGTPRSEKNRALTARLYNNLPGFCSVGDCSANFFDVGEALNILRDEEERFGWRLPDKEEVMDRVKS
jgi:hypothetical protein